MLPIYTFLLISTISYSHTQRSWRGFAGRHDPWQLSNNDRFKPVPVTRNDERFIPPPIFPPGTRDNLDFQESYMSAPPNPNWESFIPQPSFGPHAIEMMPSSSGQRRRKKYLVAQSQSKPIGYLKRKGRKNRNEFLSPGSKVHTDAAWLNQPYMNSVLANEKAWFNPPYMSSVQDDVKPWFNQPYMSSIPDNQILTWFNQPYMSSVQDDVKPWFNQPYMSSVPDNQMLTWFNQPYMSSVQDDVKPWFNQPYISSVPDNQMLTWFNQPYMSSVQDDAKPWFNQPYMSSVPGIQTPWLEFPSMWSIPGPQEAWSNRPYINYFNSWELTGPTGSQQRLEISFNGENVFSHKENQHKSKHFNKKVQINMHGDDRPFVSIWNSNNETPGEETDFFHSVADFFDTDEDSFYPDVDDDDDDTDSDFFYPGSYAGIPRPGMQYRWPADLGYDPYSPYQSMVEDEADFEFDNFSPFAPESRRFHHYDV